MAGEGKDKTPGVGAEYQQLRDEADLLRKQLDQVEGQLQQDQTSLAAAQATLNKQQVAQADSLNSVSAEVPYSDTRGADASILVFVLSLLAGITCLLVGAQRKRAGSSPKATVVEDQTKETKRQSSTTA